MSQTLIQQIAESPTPYHAVDTVKRRLVAEGFVGLDEAQEWSLIPGGKYFISRRDASIVAFIYGHAPLEKNGIRIIGAHTDSPVLKVKPNPERYSQGYLQLGVEVYGGVLLNPWFDRDLSIAGRVAVKVDGGIRHHLINFKRPIACIPNLAIHLDRAANEGRTVNPQEHMAAILTQANKGEQSFTNILAQQLRADGVVVNADEILDFDLSFYDVQLPAVIGLDQSFLASARLDNLLSCFVGLEAFVRSTGEQSAILALFDHEEVGSQSSSGAKSNLLSALLERLIPHTELRHRALARSVFLSVDNAHGIHPNYPSKHDEAHGPKLNQGLVIKYDANQGYATSTGTASMIKILAAQAGVPVQPYVTRADMRCGSTIGPISSASTGIATVDVGLPTFAMHSIRELAGTRDIENLNAILLKYLEMGDTSL
jgi:aspartyl aminopeptidase